MTEITEDLALTAMCVWEELISIMAADDPENVYVKHGQQHGACELRSVALDTIAPAVNVAYKAVSDKFDEPFDWEFVPAFLLHAGPVFASGEWQKMTAQDAVKIGHKVLSELAAVYKLDVEGDLRKPTITEAKITDLSKCAFPNMPAVIAAFDDGTEQELFSFHPDEITFHGYEFIGLTEQQARSLKRKKDVDFLQS